MKIIKLYVFTDHNAEKGIEVRKILEHEVTKSAKTYSGTGIRLNIEDFEKPMQSGSPYNPRRIYFDIWTTDENAKASVLKCVEKIITEFEERDALWNHIKQAVTKAKENIKL